MSNTSTTAREIGRRAGRLGLATSLNPFADSEHEHAEWYEGWLEIQRETLLDKIRRWPEPREAVIYAHPQLTRGDVDLICRRCGLELAGPTPAGNFELVVSKTRRPMTMLRLAAGPEAA